MEYTENLGLECHSIWGVDETDLREIAEKFDEPNSLSVEPDEGLGKPTGHCLVDFSGLPNKKSKRIGRELANRAFDRGVLFNPQAG